MEMLKLIDIKEKIRLHHLNRFRKIRDDANYRGFKVTLPQAKEISLFWDLCCNQIIDIIAQEMKK